jgi:hypothetical protein
LEAFYRSRRLAGAGRNVIGRGIFIKANLLASSDADSSIPALAITGYLDG